MVLGPHHLDFSAHNDCKMISDQLKMRIYYYFKDVIKVRSVVSALASQQVSGSSPGSDVEQQATNQTKQELKAENTKAHRITECGVCSDFYMVLLHNFMFLWYHILLLNNSLSNLWTRINIVYFLQSARRDFIKIKMRPGARLHVSRTLPRVGSKQSRGLLNNYIVKAVQD